MIRIAFFSTHEFERHYFNKANDPYHYSITYFNEQLSEKTAFLAKDHDIVCVFVNDHLDQPTLKIMKSIGVKLIALRAAGFNNVDLAAAQKLNLPVVRVPKYSPNAVAEHAVTLILALNRKICQADSRIKNGNFSLDGLVGFVLKEKTVGIV
jgi:D-lactate dehydrogenase